VRTLFRKEKEEGFRGDESRDLGGGGGKIPFISTRKTFRRSNLMSKLGVSRERRLAKVRKKRGNFQVKRREERLISRQVVRGGVGGILLPDRSTRFIPKNFIWVSLGVGGEPLMCGLRKKKAYFSMTTLEIQVPASLKSLSFLLRSRSSGEVDFLRKPLTKGEKGNSDEICSLSLGRELHFSCASLGGRR